MATGASTGVDLSQVPAAAAPSGVTSDFNNPDNYKHENIILHSVVLAFTTVAVFVRVYTRTIITKSFGIDDWFALLSWVLALEFSVVMAYATRWGFGMHIYDIRASEIVNTLKWLIVSQKSYFPLILSIKLCILLGYLRLFKIDRKTRWGIWIGIAACTIFYLVTFFIDLFRCKPVESEWNPAVNGTCLSYAAFPWATGIFNVVSDFYILLLPLPVIFKMQMQLSRRLKVASVFGLGTFTCIASIMRFVISIQYASDPDQTYVAARVLYWTILEANIGLICACATAFPAFFHPADPRSFSSLFKSLLSRASASQLNVLSLSRTKKAADGSLRSSEEGSHSQTQSMQGNFASSRKQNTYNVTTRDQNMDV